VKPERRLAGPVTPAAALAGQLRLLGGALEALATGAHPALPEPADTPLDTLAALFDLSPAARHILLLAAGPDLDSSLASRIGQFRGLNGPSRADVGTALTLAGQGGWEALCPAAPLRRWRLVDLTGTGSYLARELVVDERVLHFLMGLGYVDTGIAGLVRPLPDLPRASPSEFALAQALAPAWSGAAPWPVLIAAGEDQSALTVAAGTLAQRASLFPLVLDARRLPAEAAPLADLATWIDRELALSGAALVVEHADAAAARLADDLLGPVVLTGAEPMPPANRERLRADHAAEGRAGRSAVWRQALGTHAEALGDGLGRLSDQFALDRGAIEAAARTAATEMPRPDRLLPALWTAARAQGRRRLDGLAERIDSRAGWDDLVLPAEQTSQLRDLADRARQSWRVREDWGWETRGSRGLGTAALFTGASGTGKTLAAEVLAAELALDLFRIDLGQIVSKYIGETEKNLERIFTAAEYGGAILLFDEADALFGKRSEVRDSHDRYANVEVSYLLQRMESYRGLAILTTNQKSTLDQAFLRRLAAIVAFPFPDAPARATIWARAFPPETPQDGLDPARLARLSITGGAIRSIALNASFLAAAEGRPVTAAHVLKAARREYAKLEKPLTAAEIEGLT
jgi:vesicle-fusing ATPase